ncbi:MAG TPA: hypothetical protein PKW55_00855 [Spirochaetota bacterium]|nr:hypothetical protein [Spirochaetota bacterium]HOM39046.1 hypothetical protein [Spirochaetota bacterium]HPQ49901.1 hypothetical protein [Spirochaetota bacterium]
MRKTIICIFLLFSLFYCKKESYSEKQLVEIYARTELLPPQEAASYIKKFGLDNKENREEYYNMLRELSSDREKWIEFLEKVDEYKKNVIDVEKQKQRSINENVNK